MSAEAPTNNLPTRSATNDTDDAIPDDDASEVTRLFHERLQAWKHACAYLEDYISATEKAQHSQSKEAEKVLKTVNSPLKEGHHFDQNLGGIAGLFENIRSNTQGIANAHAESAKVLKGTVLPIFERLHTEIKHKTKELTKGAGKGAKAVDKARNTSQKHIELLGQHTGSFDSSASSINKAGDDPYVLQRQVYHRLNKQVIEENNNRDDMISVQNNFSEFENHIVQTFQNGLAQLNQVLSNHTEQIRNMYGDIAGNSQKIDPNFEWNGFLKRNGNVLIDPSAPKRSVENIGFANQDHRATKPMIAGSLERKGKVMKSYSSSYWVVTPSKYMHEYKTDDDFAKDPTPENSLYLPDCMIGAVDGMKFNVRGKDAKGGLASKFSMSHEYAFKAHSAQDAQKWHDVIASVAGQSSNETFGSDSAPGSPVGPTGQEKTGADEKLGGTEAASTAAPPTAAAEDTSAPSATAPSATAPEKTA